MTQADYQISDAQNGPQFVAELNTTLGATQTKNSGSSAPTSTYPFMWWADTQANLLKMRNSTNTAWETIGNIGQPNFGILTKALDNQYLARIVAAQNFVVAAGWNNISPQMSVLNDPNSLVNAQKAYVAPIAGWYETSLSIRIVSTQQNSANSVIGLVNNTDPKYWILQCHPAASNVTSYKGVSRIYLTQGQAAPLWVYSDPNSYSIDLADLTFRFAGLNI